MEENDIIKFWFEDGILMSEFQSEIQYDIAAVKTTIQKRIEISAGKNQYWLYDITNMKSVTTEARQYACNHGHTMLYACAAVVDSYLTKFIYTTYKKFCKPDFPVAFFTSKEKALLWLSEIKAKNEVKELA
jgi:hypothetical protein